MMTSADGRRSIGDWKNDLYDGPGTLTMADGKGILTLANGKRYALIIGRDDDIFVTYIDG